MTGFGQGHIDKCEASRGLISDFAWDLAILEFCEKKTNSGAEHQEPQKPQDDTSADGFMTIPENAADDLPFKNKK